MVSVHVFSRIPLVFGLQFGVALVPWVLVARYRSFEALLALVAALAIYTGALAWQVR